MTDDDAWYELDRGDDAHVLVMEAWSEMLETVQIWELALEQTIEHVLARRDAAILDQAEWLIVCGADGASATLVPVEDLDEDRLAASVLSVARTLGFAVEIGTP